MVTDAAPRLFAELGLTSDLLRAGIRDVLLVQWRQWNQPNGENSGIRKPIRAHFQQDIQRAVEFLEEATGQEVDLDDPYWGSSRRNMHWTPLADALPYESLGARREFPLYASMYLEKLNSLLGERRFDETRLRRLVEIWWPQSVAFRRFCLAFHRLHGHLGTSKDDKVGLRTETPVEFLILCTLHAEKILRDDHMARTMVTKVPGVRVITMSCAEVVLRSFGIPEASSAVQELGNALKLRDQLHNLPENPRDPFVVPGYFALEGKLGQLILASFANFVILRNYVAHHDCLDDQLVYTEMGETALNAVLIATLTILDR